MTASCWSCGSTVAEFYTQSDIPTGSCVLLHDRDQAIDYPTGDLRLALCETCGFIQNSAFDEALVDYTSGYEASQAFSPTFRAFVEHLIDGLVDRYDLAGATTVEPGCGSAEFLELIVERIGGRGIGLDPAFDGRPLTAGVQVRRERLTAQSTGVVGDLVVARHTLEHIADIRGFLTGARGALDPSGQSVLLIEVPESLRIMREGAFWDVYYEHASYFIEGSLIRLLDSVDLQTLRAAVEFAGQYLIVEAGRVGPAGPRLVPPSGDIVELAEAVSHFTAAVPGQIEVWGNTIASAKRPLIWGASSKAVAFLAAVGRVDHAVDINPGKHGSYLAGSGAAVHSPDDVAAIDPDLVVVMNPIYAEEIGAQLRELGVHPRIEALGA